MKYDAPFVFAEVNADIIRWMIYSDGRREKVRAGSSPGSGSFQRLGRRVRVLVFIPTDRGGPQDRGEEHQHQKCVW